MCFTLPFILFPIFLFLYIFPFLFLYIFPFLFHQRKHQSILI
ncbi:MAG: hypothetical protein MjAS7_0551 [Metallosphaera javensis (ex Sakai et al. 2022)]|nr:MAG: hypothetical protein MjAS7_0551 [Metallosphaera javensis (ex Sakai et al. 2022)]